MPRLLVVHGADEGKQFEIVGDSITIGRDAGNGVRLSDKEVSRRHAELRRSPAGYAIYDIGSANGTFVNNQKVLKADLKAGDHMAVGQTILVYQADRPGNEGDLASRISMIARGESDLGSAIVKTIHENEGSRIIRHATTTSPWLQNALANLTIMYEASQAVSHILEIDDLLNRILELVFRSIGADRGCILLRKADDPTLEPKGLRWRDPARRTETMAVSQSIVDYVLKEKVGLLLSDAARDERFGTGQSVIREGINEVICVPMRGRHETLGVLYLDTQTSHSAAIAAASKTGKFNDDHLKLASAIAHQAALAVEETRYHQALVQAERLAAIGQTIAALSHHIKNILQGLRSGNEIIAMGLKEKNENLIEKGWKVAERNQGRIYELVMDMLSFSKDRVPAVENVQLNDIVNEVVELVEARAAERGVTLEKNLLETMPIVQADPEGIHRALLNVVGNAIDAVDGQADARVVVGSRLGDDGFARLIIVDNGPGISPIHLADIFKPFVSTKGSRGTGLGLPVSRKVLREHGGDLVVQSQPNVGSRFTLKLPIHSPLAAEAAQTIGDRPLPPFDD